MNKILKEQEYIYYFRRARSRAGSMHCACTAYSKYTDNCPGQLDTSRRCGASPLLNSTCRAQIWPVIFTFPVIFQFSLSF